jgi:murein DD-endopeptidase MepM/ murein hydrolase activator NlpD
MHRSLVGKFLSFCTALYLVAALTACQTINHQAGSEFPSPVRSLDTLESTTTPIPTFLPIKNEPTVTVQRKITPPMPTATYTSTATPTATEIQRIMCSPLQDETIASIWEIITNVYDPPPPGRDDHHHGVDLAYYRRGNRLSIEGEVVQAVMPGTIAASIQDRLPYGNMVIVETPQSMIPKVIIDKFNIKPGESLYSLYAHMQQSPEVGMGDEVSCGQALGRVGTTGYEIVNPHLHLEIRVGPSGSRFANMVFYDTSATVEEMDNYMRWRTSGEFTPMDPMLVFAAYLSITLPEFQIPTP